MKKNTLTILVAYTHDFASALWVAALLAVYWATRQSVPEGFEAFLFRFKKEFFYYGIICLGVIIVTGAGRTFLYSSGQFGEGSEEAKKKVLIIKHIIGFIIYGAGTYWQYRMVFA